MRPPASSEQSLRSQHLLTELQSLGMRLTEETAGGVSSRRGGAGPSDHKAIRIAGRTVMVPIHTAGSHASPYAASRLEPGAAMLLRDGTPVGRIDFPSQPNFYGLSTAAGVPYWKIAMLHGADVLATTVLQTCIRTADRATACQFCAIGQSLEAGRTVARKSPAELAEVAEAAVRLDGVRHMVLTTGTPNIVDRGAAVLADSARAIRSAVDLPLQAQCEPPRDPAWYGTLRDAGIDSLGMHLEAATQAVRARIMPGKAIVGVERYLEAFRLAVPVFGRGQVSTYLLAGLGDSADEILALCETLIAIGVHPFVVPFVPITGTPLQHHAPPSPEFMRSVLAPLGRMLARNSLRSDAVKAGCSRCGACSSLAAYEAA